MGREMGIKLGSLVGEVEDVDTNKEGEGWGEYLRVRIQVNVLKPFVRGRLLKLKENSSWIAFQYEKISTFCVQRGIIYHGELGCLKCSN